MDATGRFLKHVTIYPHIGEGRIPQARHDLLRLVETHAIEMVAVGNGTAGREMEIFVKETLADAGRQLPVVPVSEAGASVYSASDIARRLQDPLGELVKVDPKSIGVGRYQHDVNQSMLKRALDGVVESCVNYVGVDLNTASWALLAYVSGVGPSLAKAITCYRDENGSFLSRTALVMSRIRVMQSRRGRW